MRLNSLIARRIKTPSDAGVWDGEGDDVIGLHAADGRFVRASRSAQRLFGYPADELVGLRLMDVVSVEHQPLLLSALARVASRSGPGRARFDCQLRKDDAVRAHVEIALSRLPNGGMRSVTRPIEHRLSRETALKEEGRRAVRLANEQTDHLANISHEIRTPLNAVIGFADALYAERFGPIGSERYRDYARAIHDSGTHLQTLITDLLDLAKAEANELAVVPSPADPVEVAEFCADLMRLQAQDAGLYIRLDAPSYIAPCALDVKIVRQILLNIISNALKFTNEGGITISVNQVDGELVFCVEDTGVGMTPEQLEGVGRRFSQAHAAGVRGAKGTGIGLALSQALAKAHGGKLSLDSALEKGTTAELRLPITPADEEPTSSNSRSDNVTVLADVKAR